MAKVIPLTTAGGTTTGCKMPNGDILNPPCNRFGLSLAAPQVVPSGPISTFLSGGKATYRGFMTSPDANMKNNAIFVGGAVIGAIAARKLIKKGDKDLNTVLGGVAGLLLGLGVSRIVK